MSSANTRIFNIYKAAVKDEEFNSEMLRQDPNGYTSPQKWWGDKEKAFYSCAYYGYLLGKGKYNRNDYE